MITTCNIPSNLSFVVALMVVRAIADDDAASKKLIAHCEPHAAFCNRTKLSVMHARGFQPKGIIVERKPSITTHTHAIQSVVQYFLEHPWIIKPKAAGNSPSQAVASQPAVDRFSIQIFTAHVESIPYTNPYIAACFLVGASTQLFISPTNASHPNVSIP